MMKPIFALCTAGVLSACMSTAPVETSNSVDALLDKRLVAENGTVFMIGSDGSMSGEFRGDAIKGTHKSTATEICSTLTTPEIIAGERCSTPVISGNTVYFDRRDGSKSALYTIEG